MSGKKLRLAFGRINQETNALSPVKTTLADFKSTHYFEGAALLAGCQKNAHEVPSMFKNAELSGFVQEAQRHSDVELVPLVSAWAVPSGPLTRACFDALVTAMADAVRKAGPLDGVYLALHGAMGVDGVVEPEGEIVRAVRAVVGDSIPVIITLDLHGNVTRVLVAACTAVLAYATNPHRDHRSLGGRAARMLRDTCLGRVKPTMAWRSLPMLLGGGTTLDFWPPLLQIFRRMRALERSGAVLSASLLTVHPWNAHPELGWAVVVVTNGDQAAAERIADELAERGWGTRHQLPPTFVDASTAVRAARGARLRRKLGAVILADASDVVTAGAPGENTALLRTLIDEGQGLLSYVPLRDPHTIAELWGRPVGERVRVTLGGRLDAARSQPLDVDATIVSQTRAHGVERVIVLAIGTVRVIVVEGPAIAMRPAFFSTAGLNPWKADVIVVKNFFPFRMFFLPLARKTIYVRTQGVTDFDAAFALPFAGPVHPKDVVHDWREADRRRRAA